MKHLLVPIVMAIACVVAAMAGARIAEAQPYPNRPITVVVPFPAGGPTDALLRVIGDRMRISLGQPLIAENVSGATGSIAVGRVAPKQVVLTPSGRHLRSQFVILKLSLSRAGQLDIAQLDRAIRHDHLPWMA